MLTSDYTLSKICVFYPPNIVLLCLSTKTSRQIGNWTSEQCVQYTQWIVESKVEEINYIHFSIATRFCRYIWFDAKMLNFLSDFTHPIQRGLFLFLVCSNLCFHLNIHSSKPTKLSWQELFTTFSRINPLVMQRVHISYGSIRRIRTQVPIYMYNGNMVSTTDTTCHRVDERN